MRSADQASIFPIIIIERDVHVDPAPDTRLKAGELCGELFLRVVLRQLLGRDALGGGIHEGGVIVSPNLAHDCSPVDVSHHVNIFERNAGMSRTPLVREGLNPTTIAYSKAYSYEYS
mmetsp:Transcript_14449/g.62679  ORF Transcript_14449/g.62679 Transcript_14449/m.62679 type:complete len:117 (+) Transcript_14449:719-1069(+)